MEIQKSLNIKKKKQQTCNRRTELKESLSLTSDYTKSYSNQNSMTLAQ